MVQIHDKSDKGLDDLTERALKHNPDIRVLAQVGWLPYDDPIFPMPEKGREKTNWNARSIKEVRAIHAAYFKNASDQVQALNKRLGKQVVFIVPVAQAVMALREKIAAGEARRAENAGRSVLRLHRPRPAARGTAQRLLSLCRHLSSHPRGAGDKGARMRSCTAYFRSWPGMPSPRNRSVA